MIELAARVRLSQRARLRFDRHSGKHVLLYPERGLELNASGERIVALCAEERAVSEIIDAVAALAGDAPRDVIERDVLGFLRALDDRGLLEVTPP